MDRECYDNYVQILTEELEPALGCTEPIAIAYCASVMRNTLGVLPEKLAVRTSGNIIKNVKAVTVPNSGGKKGIEAAAVLGCIGGRQDLVLEVLSCITDEDRSRAEELLKQGYVSVSLATDVPSLYIEITGTAGGHSCTCTLAGAHTNITYLEKDGCWSTGRPPVLPVPRSLTARRKACLSPASSSLRRLSLLMTSLP